ncbi:hypothetical protein D3C87_820550 [compost metagenome]
MNCSMLIDYLTGQGFRFYHTLTQFLDESNVKEFHAPNENDFPLLIHLVGFDSDTLVSVNLEDCDDYQEFKADLQAKLEASEEAKDRRAFTMDLEKESFLGIRINHDGSGITISDGQAAKIEPDLLALAKNSGAEIADCIRKQSAAHRNRELPNSKWALFSKLKNGGEWRFSTVVLRSDIRDYKLSQFSFKFLD